jgi:acetyl-CoA carboxylase alpha subunit
MIPFEKPLVDLEHRIDELKRVASSQLKNVDGELADLESKRT